MADSMFHRMVYNKVEFSNRLITNVNKKQISLTAGGKTGWD